MRRAFIKYALFFILSFLVCSIQAFANEIEIEDLRYNWRFHDENTQSFLPFLSSVSTECVYFTLDNKKHEGFDLKLELAKGYYVFLDGILIEKSEKASAYYFSIDSLRTQYPEKELIFSIYTSNFVESQVRTTVVDRNRSVNKNDSNELLLAIPRQFDDSSNRFITLSILLLGLIVTFRTLSFRMFSEYFSIADAFSARPKFELINSQSLFTAIGLAFIILYSVIVSVSAYNIALFDDTFYLPLGNYTRKLPISWNAVLVFILCLSSIMAKRFLVSVATRVFVFRKIRNLHYYTYFRFSLLMAFGFFIISIINGVSRGEFLDLYSEYVHGLCVVALLFRLMMIYIVLNSQLNFHKTQIFVYLCSTEIIPLVFFLKIFLYNNL